MRTINQLYKKKYLARGLTFWGITLIEIILFISFITHEFDFISNTNQGIVGAIFGFILIISVYMSFDLYKQYFVSQGNKIEYEKLLQESEMKFQVLSDEIERQKMTIEKKIDVIMNTNEQNIEGEVSTLYRELKNYLISLEKEDIELRRRKLYELQNILERVKKISSIED